MPYLYWYISPLQDSLVDLVVSLGVPLDHLILGLPATAAVFTLKDEELNTPRSPAAGTASFIPYREVRDSAVWLPMFQCLCNDYHNKDNNDNDYDINKR